MPTPLAKLTWSHTVLDYQIDSAAFERQAIAQKLTNFDNKLPIAQSELARDIENAMLEKIKNVLLELGKGFSFVGNQ